VPKDPSPPTEYSFGMSEDMPFVGEPADSREAIMHATHRALSEHGYAGLSIQRIADEADLSKSTFYHHYDGKDDLLTSFVDFSLEKFIEVFSMESGDDPLANLWTFVDLLTCTDPDIDGELPEDIQGIIGTIVELQAQAVRDDAVRRKFTEANDVFTAQVADIIRAAVDEGQIEEVDPDAAAAFVVTVVSGSMVHRTTVDDHDLDLVRSELRSYIDSHLAG